MSDVDDDTPVRPGGTRKRRSFALEDHSALDGETGGGAAAVGRKKQKQASHKSVSNLQGFAKEHYLPFFQAKPRQTKHKGDQLAVSEAEISTEESSDGQTTLNEVRARPKIAPARRGPKTDTQSHWLEPVAIIEPGKVPDRWQFKCKHCET